jgi:hypothetical protein
MTEENEIITPAVYFKENKYAIVDSAVPLDICQNLSDYILKLVEDKKTGKDTQCPLSESVYGDSMLDILLEDVRPTIEKATGLNLIPTYSYARKYLPGNELKPHLDREACEISATITLGYEGDLWPIHVSTDDKVENDIGEILIDVGSMVVYRGTEINHWREPYTQGKWQCQVFLHYVDADGPHKDLKYDGRESLGAKRIVESNDEPSNPNWIFGHPPHDKYLYMIKDNVLSAPLIDSIILHGSKNTEIAEIGGGTRAIIDKNIRNVSHSWLPFDKFDWLYSLLEEEIKNINWLNFKFVLNSMEKIDYLEYHAGDEAGKYEAHIDGSINSNRKLSFSVLLSDPSEYDGGDLIIYEIPKNPMIIPKRKGMITFFPSNVVHEVTPVTRGVRRSIVSWIQGPVFC